jgi:protease-4
MIKKFFISFFASMAAVWLSIALFGFLVIYTIFSLAGGFSSLLSSAKSGPSVKSGTVLCLDLSGSIAEQPEHMEFADMVMNREISSTQVLADVVDAIYTAADDPRVDGIYADCDGVMAGVATLSDIREALSYFRSKKKWILAYSDSYSQADYYTISPASEIWVNPIGSVDVHGLNATTMFYTGLFEKLGVKMQVVKVGTYKSAVEPYILKQMSPASRLQQEEYLGSIWGDIASEMARSRGISKARLNALADDMVELAPADSILAAKLVNKLGYRFEAEQRVAELAGKQKFEDVNMLSIDEYVSVGEAPNAKMMFASSKKDTPRIAVLYACGEITESSGDGIVGDDMVDQIFDLMENAEDDDLRGLVMRVNSPGGSAFASEQIWNALQQFKKKTGLPVYVSMGDYAASGGYYISCGADKIFAQPTTLTGSIGIFGMIPDLSGLLDKHLGVTTESVATNRNAGFPSIFTPMTAEQAEKLQANVARGYELFTSRCAAGRHMPVDSIKAIAEGRVWSGRQALGLHLVDSLGSLRTTILAMAKDLGLDDYKVCQYPETNLKWWEQLLQSSDIDMKAAGSSTAVDADTWELYTQINRIKNAPRIQCRMETVKITL